MLYALQSISVAGLTLRENPWLFAQTITMLHAAGLVVYRSVLVRDSDPIYAPVAAFLAEQVVRPLHREVVPDLDMMFGQAELSVYLLEEA